MEERTLKSVSGWLSMQSRPLHCVWRAQPPDQHPWSLSAAAALPPSCTVLTFWFNFICHRRTITKKGTIHPHHLAWPPQAPQPPHSSPGPSEGSLGAGIALPPSSLDGCPVFVVLQINLLKPRSRLQPVTQKTINNIADFVQRKKRKRAQKVYLSLYLTGNQLKRKCPPATPCPWNKCDRP